MPDSIDSTTLKMKIAAMRKHKDSVEELFELLENKKVSTGRQYRTFCEAYVIALLELYVRDINVREPMLASFQLLEDYDQLRMVRDRRMRYSERARDTNELINKDWADPNDSLEDIEDVEIEKLVGKLMNDVLDSEKKRKPLGLERKVKKQLDKQYPKGWPPKLPLPKPRYKEQSAKTAQSAKLDDTKATDSEPNYTVNQSAQINTPEAHAHSEAAAVAQSIVQVIVNVPSVSPTSNDSTSIIPARIVSGACPSLGPTPDFDDNPTLLEPDPKLNLASAPKSGHTTSIESKRPHEITIKNQNSPEVSQFTIEEAPLAFGWGDSSGGGCRPNYTLAQVKGGILGDTIVFNSISDSVIGNEKNFLGVREDDGKHTGLGNVWHSNRIAVEDGETYIIRLYIHNNNPTGAYAIAKDVRAAISLPCIAGKQIRVTGFIESSNANPNKYWADVVFYSNEAAFRLKYIFGSAILENNVFGKYTRISDYPNIKVSDDIVTRASSGGILVNYNTLDGSIPGGYQYACYISIRIRVVFDTQ